MTEINNNLDQIADQIDLSVNHREGQIITRLGLTIHYSTEEKRFWAGYGKKHPKHRVWGATAEEALKNLVSKLNTPLTK